MQQHGDLDLQLRAMANTTTRYWAGVGPKFIQCQGPKCNASIPTGALVHKHYELNEKPKCWTCGKPYIIPAGAERPYLKGLGLNGQNARNGKGGKGKGESATGQKDKEIENLKRLLREAKVELPKETQTNKEDLEGLKAAREVMLKQGLPTKELDAKIQELEAATKIPKLALPAIEARLTAAQVKVQKCIGRYKQALEQLKQAKEAGTEAVKLVEELEKQKIEALDGQGFEPKTTAEMEKAPEDLDQDQQDQWRQAVKMHEEQQRQIAKQATEVLAEHLQNMHENFKLANAVTKQVEQEQASAEAEAKADTVVLSDMDEDEPYPWDAASFDDPYSMAPSTEPGEARAEPMQVDKNATKRKADAEAAGKADSGTPGAASCDNSNGNDSTKANKKAARSFLQKVKTSTAS